VEAGHTGAGRATTAPVIALTRRQGGGVSGVVLDEVRPASVSQLVLGVVALEYIPVRAPSPSRWTATVAETTTFTARHFDGTRVHLANESYFRRSAVTRDEASKTIKGCEVTALRLHQDGG